MNLHELVSQLIIDTKGTVAGGLLSLPSRDSSLGVFLPEICVCVTIVLMLLVRVFRFGRRVDAFYFAAFGSALALYFAAPWQHLGASPPSFADPTSVTDAAAVTRMEIFTGMLVYDPFSIFVRSVLLAFAFLFAVFTKLSGIPDREDGPDIYTLVLGSTLGMCMMASANHLLMVFMAVEMASVPSYVLAGMLKGRRVGSEAALKYSIYGAGAAGVMLYGISLVSGLLNTAHLPTIALELADRLPSMPASELMVLVLGGLMIMVGLAFKLSAVPFHFWCPDVFEGATAEVNAFLSVASKAAALALLVRVAIGFGGIAPEGVAPGERSLAVANQGRLPATESLAQLATTDGLFSFAPEDEAQPSFSDHVTGAAAEEGHTGGSHTGADASTPLLSANNGLAKSRDFLAKLIALLAVVSCTFGNLAAYGQANIKRLMAYSTIAHAGYMMMPVPAMLVLMNYDSRLAESTIAGLSVYIVVYLFMSLGAFAIIAFLRNAMRSEMIADYAGLIRRCPITVVCFVLILFSLIGLPPLAGFVGKFAIFAGLVDAYRVSLGAGEPATFLMVMLIAGGLNTAISLVYYLRVAKVMTMDPEPEDRQPFVFSDVSLQGAYIWFLTLPTLLLMLNWDVLNRWAEAAATYLLA